MLLITRRDSRFDSTANLFSPRLSRNDVTIILNRYSLTVRYIKNWWFLDWSIPTENGRHVTNDLRVENCEPLGVNGNIIPVKPLQFQLISVSISKITWIPSREAHRARWWEYFVCKLVGASPSFQWTMSTNHGNNTPLPVAFFWRYFFYNLSGKNLASLFAARHIPTEHLSFRR